MDSARFLSASNSAVYTATGENEEPRTSLVPLDGAGPGRLDFGTGRLASPKAPAMPTSFPTAPSSPA